MNYGYQNPYQQQQMINPVLLNAQNRLQQAENQYAQYQSQNIYPQQQVVVPQPSVLNGRVVDNIDSVTVNEIPQDGSSAVFIKSDLSEIYLKSWNKNGLIDTSVYKRQIIEETVPEETKDNHLEEALSVFQDKLQSIEDKLNKALTSPTTNTKPRSVVKEGK